MSTDISPITNRVVVVGALAHQFRRGTSFAILNRRNELDAIDSTVYLQIPAPFGGTQAIGIEVYPQIDGFAFLAGAADGALVACEGHLEWRRPPGSAEDPKPRGELMVCAERIRPAEAHEAHGSNVWIQGVVSADIHFNPHRQRSELTLAQATVMVSFVRTRGEQPERFTQSLRVPFAIPVVHPQIDAMLRSGNLVAITGVLERFLSPRDKPGVAHALALAEAWWEVERARLVAEGGNLEQGLQRYQRRRRAAGNELRTRLIPSEVRLIAGEPRTLDEARAAYIPGVPRARAALAPTP